VNITFQNFFCVLVCDKRVYAWTAPTWNDGDCLERTKHPHSSQRSEVTQRKSHCNIPTSQRRQSQDMRTGQPTLRKHAITSRYSE